jgi:RNA polymerase sigma-70 factor, ECF subfamily
MMTKLSVAELRTATVAQLVQATQSGQREAFGELFERFERQVFSIALRRIGDYGEAQEVCQDVFVQAMQKIAQLREPERFGGWLRSIANRMAINRVVRRRPEVAAEPETLASACVDERTPLTAVMAQRVAIASASRLGSAAHVDRQTLVAFYVQGQSLLEMSDALTRRWARSSGVCTWLASGWPRASRRRSPSEQNGVGSRFRAHRPQIHLQRTARSPQL